MGLAYLSAGAQQQSPELLGKAFPLIAEARQAFPRDSELTAGLGLYAHLKGMYRKAAEIFDLAIQMRPAYLRRITPAQKRVAAGDPAKDIHTT